MNERESLFPFRDYEADHQGRIYERYGDEAVWPTGITLKALAGESHIPAEVIERELRRMDELEGES